MALSEWARDFLDPWISAMYATPFIALAPLFVLWLGIGMAAHAAVKRCPQQFAGHSVGELHFRGYLAYARLLARGGTLDDAEAHADGHKG